LLYSMMYSTNMEMMPLTPSPEPHAPSVSTLDGFHDVFDEYGDGAPGGVILTCAASWTFS
jgi:hypothetical protein